MSLVPLHRLTADAVGARCLVTGGAGYLGTHLAAALVALGCEVRSLDVRPCGVAGVTDHIADVCDAEAVADAMAGVDTAFHAAALIPLVGFAPRGVRRRVFAVNEGGTANVAAAATAAGVGALVFTSSANVCIDGVCDELDEDAPYATRWVDLYGPSKAAAERLVLAADAPGGLRTCALRPGGLWGGGGGGLMIRSFLDQLAGGRFVATIGDGTALADNTHVDTLVWAELLAASRLRAAPERAGGRAFFVTDDERVNGIRWFKPIVDGLGLPWPERRLPGWLMWAVALAGELTHAAGGPEPLLTRIGVLKLTTSTAFRVDRARRDLGWEPLIGHEAGLALHLDDYRRYVEARRG